MKKTTYIVWIVSLITGFSQVITAQTITSEPILRLNTEIHARRIGRVESDAAGRYLITASSDKTSRLWDTSTGELVGVLRVPIRDRSEGQVYAATLSPDGTRAAIGGLVFNDDGHGVVFVYDVPSGTLINTVSLEAEFSIHDLSFSPDGRYIALGTEGQPESEVVVFETDTMRIVERLPGFGRRVNDVSWSSDGRLAAASFDGQVRLYSRQFELDHIVRLGADVLPYGLAFSPDGERLAVGFAGANRIQVLDGWSLELLYEPVTHGDDGLAVLSPAWSRDGHLLFAGSSATRIMERERQRFLRVWQDAGRGTYYDITVAQEDIRAIAPLPNGQIAVVSDHPDIAVVSVQGSVIWQRRSEGLSYRVFDRSNLRLSARAEKVGASPRGTLPFVFDINGRRISEASEQLAPARSVVGEMRFSNWMGTFGEVALNGRILEFLHPLELSSTVSVGPTGSLAVLGTSWGVYGVNQDGTPAWRIRPPGEPWAVNVAASGRVFVAAYGDGTVRWHRTSDGQELLAFFFHADRERWILWTPSGYYDASPGGEDLIGWHVNRGIDGTPDFYPASTFRDRFYRPDIVQEILVSYDEETAVAAANERRGVRVTTQIADVLPPTVRIVSPRRDAEITEQTLTVEVEIATPDDAPVTDVQVRVNGRPQHGVRGLVRAESDTRRRIPVNLSQVVGTDAFITVQAANRHGIGPAADLRVRLIGRTFQEFVAAPKLYVLAVGVSEYRDSSLNLMYAAKDARDVTAFLRDQAGGLYREVEVRTITDRDATLQAIRDGLFWLEEQVTANDMAKIFIAGHGINDNTGQLHFAPYDVDVNRLRRTGLPASDIVDTISYIQGRVVYFMDACHSGNLDFVRRSVGGVDLNRHIQDLSAAENGAVVFSSAAGSQYALESDEWGNGAFTRAMLEGLRGAADYNGDGAVSVNELNLYVSEAVKALTNNQQTPVMQRPNSIRDFPLATVR